LSWLNLINLNLFKIKKLYNLLKFSQGEKMKKSLLVLATLGFALSLNAADLTDTCKSYFSDIDKMVEAYKQAGQEQQVKMYEDQKKQSMDQLAALPKEQQDATCKQAKEMFAQVMDQMKKQGLLK
jgi:hypothetical protein